MLYRHYTNLMINSLSETKSYYQECPVEAATSQSSHLVAVQAKCLTPISIEFSVVT